MPNLSQPTTDPVETVQWTDDDTTHIGRIVQANGRDVSRITHGRLQCLVQHWPYDVHAKFEWVTMNRLDLYTGAKGTDHA